MARPRAQRTTIARNVWRCRAVAAAAVWATLTAGALAQRPVHYFHAANLPPGTVAQGQLLRGGPLAGWYQPVEITVPDGARIALAGEGGFEPSSQHTALAGLLIGPVYALRVMNIPNHDGREVFPTIEVINRLYPPPGLETRHPIPIQISQEELELALKGSFITRVIYLEDPQAALPLGQVAGAQRSFDVAPHQDPLQVADHLGRPMAILRMGSRVPDQDVLASGWRSPAPPWLRLEPTPATSAEPAPSVATPAERFGRDIPRTPETTAAPETATQPAPPRR